MAETTAQAIARRQRERAALEDEERARVQRRRSVTGAPPDYVQRPGGGLGGGLREAALQADAAMRSAANTLTLGGANSLAAGLDALVPVGSRGLGQRYANRLAAYRARDQYDAIHRPTAQNVGAGAATAFSLLGDGAPAALKRIAGAATTSARETAAILGAGGLSGLAWQNLSDAAGHRPTDWRDGLGAVAGGVAGGAALPLGAGRAAAIQSAATITAQDALHGRAASAAELGRSAAAGRAIGSLAGAAGRTWSDGLIREAKGSLGEGLGAVRSAVNGMDRDFGPKKLIEAVKGKPRTRPDGQSGDVFFEDKFGPNAGLSAGQRLARDAPHLNYTIYHFLPQDVGKMLSLPTAGLAPQLPPHLIGAFPASRRPR